MFKSGEEFMAFRELKVFCGAVAFVFMSFPQMVLAEDKIDELIQAYNLRANIERSYMRLDHHWPIFAK